MKPLNVLAPAVNETKDEAKLPYAAPELFVVGETVELIQGAQWRGPRDHANSWPIWPL